MADQVTVDNGTGTDYDVSTDDAGAAGQVQRVKLAMAADGSATHVPADADGLLVNLGANNDVVASGTVTANAGTNLNTSALALEAGGNLAGAATSLALIDDAVVADDAAFTPATTKVVMAGFEFDDTSPDSVNEGDAGAGRMSANRNQYTTIRDAAGNERGVNVSAANALAVEVTAALPAGTANIGDVDVLSLPALPAGNNNIGDVDVASLPALAAGTNNIGDVDVLTLPALPAGSNAIGKLAANTGVDIGDVDVTSVVPGTAATNLGKAEDAAHTTGDVGVMALAVRTDTAAARATTDGDYIPLTTDSTGRLWVSEGGAALTALQLMDDTIIADDAAFTPATSKVSMAGFQADEASTDSVDEGDAGAARMTLDRKVIVTPQPHSAGGCSIFRSIDLDEGTLEIVKNSPGCVYGMWVTNTFTATRFIKFYDATSGTAGTGTPVITIGIPGNTSDDVAGSFGPGGIGINFATGICVGATTGVADNDTGAPGANEVIVNVFYK